MTRDELHTAVLDGLDVLGPTTVASVKRFVGNGATLIQVAEALQRLRAADLTVVDTAAVPYLWELA